MQRPSKDKYYIDIALAVSKRSTCLRRHYGAVIVKDDVIVATGYNGSPRGEENCCDCGVCKRENAERYSGYEDCPAVHAEQNALLAVDRAHSQGATLYLACEGYDFYCGNSGLKCEDDCSLFEDDCHNRRLLLIEDRNPRPCNLCARMLKNAGITRVVNRRGEVDIWA
jgi:dCMP deaminase